MPRAKRIMTSVALGAALSCVAMLAPRMAAADSNHRGKDRHEARHERRDDRHDERRGDGRYAWQGGRHYDGHYRYYEPRHEAHGRVVVRIGGPPVVYLPPPPPPPVPVYYDPYCHTSYASLALFANHASANGHISFVWVMNGGRPMYPYRYDHDRWERTAYWWPSGGWARHCD